MILILLVLVLILILVLILLLLLVLLILQVLLCIDVILFCIYVAGIQQQALFKGIYRTLPILAGDIDISQIEVIICPMTAFRGEVFQLFKRFFCRIEGTQPVMDAGQVVVSGKGCGILVQGAHVLYRRSPVVALSIATVAGANLAPVHLRLGR